MKFDVARAEGERVISELLRKIHQDTGNARWIGRMALGPLERRFADQTPNHLSDHEPSPVVTDESSTIDIPAPTQPVSEWSILSASELIDYLATCDVEDVHQILREEREKLARVAVIEAALNRLG